MDLKVVIGKTIELPAEFFTGDEPTDPGTPRVDIVDPHGVVVISKATPVRKRKGIYLYNYPVPASAPTGTWKAVWSAMIDGSRVSASDPFEVLPAAAKPPAPAAAPPPRAEAKASDAPKPPDAPPAASPADAAGPASKPKDEGPPSSAPAGAGPSGAKQVKESKKSQAKAGRPKANGDRAKRGSKREAPSEPDGAEPRARLSKGKALLVVGALAVIIAAIWFSPRREDTVQAKIDQGVAAQKAGRTDEATRLYEDVLQNDPNNKLANFNLGVAAHAAGDTEKAETFYVKSLQTDPDFLPALFNLAILQENTGRNEESAETYRRLLEKYPDNGPAHLNYGFLLAQKLNNPEEGRAEFSRAVELDPGLAARIPADLRPDPAPAP